MQHHDNLYELDFRRRCGELCARFNTVAPLKTISFVGAYDAVIGGEEKDSYRLTQILEYLLKSGVPIDPEFIVDVVNFREGRDFLREDSQTDLVIVSYIIAGRSHYDKLFSKEMVSAYSELDLIDMVSFRNSESGWLERASEAGAKFVVTYGGNVEISAQIFSDDYGINYKVLIPSPDDECMGRYILQKDIPALYPTIKHIDLPMAWLGFSVEKDYLNEMKSSLNSNTALGRQGIIALGERALR